MQHKKEPSDFQIQFLVFEKLTARLSPAIEDAINAMLLFYFNSMVGTCCLSLSIIEDFYFPSSPEFRS